mgnify:CR=1 FL=1|jgi:hypothetical protein
MKNKIILLIALTTIVTLSFTFASVKKTEVKETTTQQTQNEPVGGFVSEDKF